MAFRDSAPRRIVRLALAVVILGLLYLASREDYLLFHVPVEMFSIVIAFGIFAFAWNTRHIIESNYLLFLGISYPFAGAVDLVHTLAYRGMGIIPGDTTNLATQLWIAARFLQAGSLVAAAVSWRRRPNPELLLTVYTVITGALLLLILRTDLFPACFIEGAGLTTFKIASEFTICLMLAAALLLLFGLRHRLDTHVFHLLVGSIAATIVSELAFTAYSDPYGLPNLIGHYLKVASFYMVYKAIIETGLTKPFSILFYRMKQREEEVRQKADIIDETHDSIISTDLKGHVMSWNKGAERLFGYSESDVLNRNISLLYPDGKRPIPPSSLINDPSKGDQGETEARLLKKSGEEFWGFVSVSLIRDSGGSPTGTIEYSMDISSRKEADEERERLTRLKDGFIRMASHDLKNPLMAVNGLAGLVQELCPPGSEMTEEAADCLRRIKRSSEIMYSIILDFLDFRAIEDGHLRLNMQPVSLGEITEDVVKMNRQYANGKKINMIVRCEKDLPQVTADPDRIRQVIENLVNNAIKFSPRESRILISSHSDSGRVVLEVVDSGPGLTQEDLKNVFKKYSRLKNRPTGGEVSVGLGLAISRELTDLQAGEIGVRNNPDHGCTFWIRLPVVDFASRVPDSGEKEPDIIDGTQKS